ncbi:class I SAM-dependent methyltransferase [Chondromyces crocatus]|uniref:rRNA methyltransferase n=1 Tax=Chondromyces crocatus TaxID=52 RepID=A0A0K1EMD8_CHOCO|nr:class I SAM-dependent methyltransferase [Chondromyces crocatus]AKT42034.1 rRNA methyltransferase [Chondromyces crocatus]
MRTQIGKNQLDIARDELLARLEGHSRVLVDVGTGDGRFVYRWASAHPETLCIGLDAVGERMREVSHRASRKPARGGRPNALFVVASAQALPEELTGLADLISINYPWSSLFSALVLPDPVVLAGLRRVARPGAELLLLLNQSVLDDRPYAERLGLPPLSEERIESELRPAYLAAGFTLLEHRLLEGDAPHQTSWGQHLTLGSGRRTRLVTAQAVNPASMSASEPRASSGAAEGD